MISSRVPSTPGILSENGIIHLPRLHQKATLARTGNLDDEYSACGKGFDQMILDGLGINREEFMDHIDSGQPTIIDTENWILQKRGGKRLTIDEETQLNQSILGYEHDETTRSTILEAAGIDDDGSIRDAVTLNEIDDRTAFYLKQLECIQETATA